MFWLDQSGSMAISVAKWRLSLSGVGGIRAFRDKIDKTSNNLALGHDYHGYLFIMKFFN